MNTATNARNICNNGIRSFAQDPLQFDSPKKTLLERKYALNLTNATHLYTCSRSIVTAYSRGIQSVSCYSE